MDKNFTKIYDGEGLVEADRLKVEGVNFILSAVMPGDVITIGPAEGDQFTAVVADALDAETLLLDRPLPVNLRHLAGQPVAFEIGRTVEQCPECEMREGHLHCLQCQGAVRLAAKRTHCEACLAGVRQAISADNEYQSDIGLFNGKLVVTFRSRTVEDELTFLAWYTDRMAEFSRPSNFFIASLGEKGRLVQNIAKDKDGKSPKDFIKRSANPEEGLTPAEEIEQMLGYFRDRNPVYMQAMNVGAHRIEQRLLEACSLPVEDDATDEQIMAIAEHMATSDKEYLGSVPILGGEDTVVFGTGDVTEIEQVERMFEQTVEQAPQMSQGHRQMLNNVLRMAVHFRGDGKEDFISNKRQVAHRLQYIAGLNQNLFRVYCAAFNVFDRRVARACTPETIKNS